jgi:hypothetical protein
MRMNRTPTILAAACAIVLACATMSLAQVELPLTAEELQAIRMATVDPSNQAIMMNFRLVELLKLGTAESVIPIRQRIRIQPDGKYFVSFSLKAGSDDVVFTVQKRLATWFYRTDSTRVLRAAAILDSTGARAVPIDDAMLSYKVALQIWSDLVRNNMPEQ